MKKILLGTAAATALVAVASPAAAETSERHYASPGPIPYKLTNPNAVGALIGEAGILAEVGTRYTATADAPSDTQTASPTVTVVFTLTGSVNKDCSFYSGNDNDSPTRNINFGVVGIRTGNNENVNDAFEMVGPAEADVDTLTAGCNFNNEVEIVKNNVNGMVNAAAGGYDTNQFQANIPYSVSASWTGVALNAVTTGSPQSLNVATNVLSGVKQQGAWRSNMAIDFDAPAITNKGLVAGTYTGTTTLTLRAL